MVVVNLVFTILTGVAAILAIVGFPFAVVLAISAHYSVDQHTKKNLWFGSIVSFLGPLALIALFYTIRQIVAFIAA